MVRRSRRQAIRKAIKQEETSTESASKDDDDAPAAAANASAESKSAPGDKRNEKRIAEGHKDSEGPHSSCEDDDSPGAASSVTGRAGKKKAGLSDRADALKQEARLSGIHASGKIEASTTDDDDDEDDNIPLSRLLQKIKGESSHGANRRGGSLNPFSSGSSSESEDEPDSTLEAKGYSSSSQHETKRDEISASSKNYESEESFESIDDEGDGKKADTFATSDSEPESPQKEKKDIFASSDSEPESPVKQRRDIFASSDSEVDSPVKAQPKLDTLNQAGHGVIRVRKPVQIVSHAEKLEYGGESSGTIGTGENLMVGEETNRIESNPADSAFTSDDMTPGTISGKSDDPAGTVSGKNDDITIVVAGLSQDELSSRDESPTEKTQLVDSVVGAEKATEAKVDVKESEGVDLETELSEPTKQTEAGNNDDSTDGSATVDAMLENYKSSINLDTAVVKAQSPEIYPQAPPKNIHGAAESEETHSSEAQLSEQTQTALKEEARDPASPADQHVSTVESTRIEPAVNSSEDGTERLYDVHFEAETRMDSTAEGEDHSSDDHMEAKPAAESNKDRVEHLPDDRMEAEPTSELNKDETEDFSGNEMDVEPTVDSDKSKTEDLADQDATSISLGRSSGQESEGRIAESGLENDAAVPPAVIHDNSDKPADSDGVDISVQEVIIAKKVDQIACDNDNGGNAQVEKEGGVSVGSSGQKLCDTTTNQFLEEERLTQKKINSIESQDRSDMVGPLESKSPETVTTHQAGEAATSETGVLPIDQVENPEIKMVDSDADPGADPEVDPEVDTNADLVANAGVGPAVGPDADSEADPKADPEAEQTAQEMEATDRSTQDATDKSLSETSANLRTHGNIDVQRTTIAINSAEKQTHVVDRNAYAPDTIEEDQAAEISAAFNVGDQYNETVLLEAAVVDKEVDEIKSKGDSDENSRDDSLEHSVENDKQPPNELASSLDIDEKANSSQVSAADCTREKSTGPGLAAVDQGYILIQTETDACGIKENARISFPDTSNIPGGVTDTNHRDIAMGLSSSEVVAVIEGEAPVEVIDKGNDDVQNITKGEEANSKSALDAEEVCGEVIVDAEAISNDFVQRNSSSPESNPIGVNEPIEKPISSESAVRTDGVDAGRVEPIQDYDVNRNVYENASDRAFFGDPLPDEEEGTAKTVQLIRNAVGQIGEASLKEDENAAETNLSSSIAGCVEITCESNTCAQVAHTKEDKLDIAGGNQEAEVEAGNDGSSGKMQRSEVDNSRENMAEDKAALSEEANGFQNILNQEMQSNSQIDSAGNGRSPYHLVECDAVSSSIHENDGTLLFDKQQAVPAIEITNIVPNSRHNESPTRAMIDDVPEALRGGSMDHGGDQSKAENNPCEWPVESESDEEEGKDVFRSFRKKPSKQKRGRNRKRKKSVAIRVVLKKSLPAPLLTSQGDSVLSPNLVSPLIFSHDRFDDGFDNSVRFFSDPHEDQDPAYLKMISDKEIRNLEAKLQSLEAEEKMGKEDIDALVELQMKEKQKSTQNNVENYKLKMMEEESSDLKRIKQMYNEKITLNQQKISQGIQVLQKRHVQESQVYLQQHRQQAQQRHMTEQMASNEWAAASQRLMIKQRQQMTNFTSKGEEAKRRYEAEFKSKGDERRLHTMKKIRDVEESLQGHLKKIHSSFEQVRQRYIWRHRQKIKERKAGIRKKLEIARSIDVSGAVGDVVSTPHKEEPSKNKESKAELQSPPPIKTMPKWMEETTREHSGAASRHKHRKGVLSQLSKQLSIEIHNEGVWLSVIKDNFQKSESGDESKEKNGTTSSDQKRFIPWSADARALLESIACGEIPEGDGLDFLRFDDTASLYGSHVRCVMTDLRSGDITSSSQRIRGVEMQIKAGFDSLEKNVSETSSAVSDAEKNLEMAEKREKEISDRAGQIAIEVEKCTKQLQHFREKYKIYLNADDTPVSNIKPTDRDKLLKAVSTYKENMESAEKKDILAKSGLSEAKSQVQSIKAQIKQAQKLAATALTVLKKKKAALEAKEIGANKKGHGAAEADRSSVRVEDAIAALSQTADIRREQLFHKRNNGSSTAWVSSLPDMSGSLRKSLWHKMHRRRQQIVLRPSTESLMSSLRQDVRTKLSSKEPSGMSIEDELTKTEKQYLVSAHPMLPEGMRSTPPSGSHEKWSEPGWHLNLDVPRPRRGGILPCSPVFPAVQKNSSEILSAPGRQTASLIHNTHLHALSTSLSPVAIASSLSETDALSRFSIAPENDASGDPLNASHESLVIGYNFSLQEEVTKSPTAKRKPATTKDSGVPSAPAAATKSQAQKSTNIFNTSSATPSEAENSKTERKRKETAKQESTPRVVQKRKADAQASIEAKKSKTSHSPQASSSKNTSTKESYVRQRNPASQEKTTTSPPYGQFVKSLNAPQTAAQQQAFQQQLLQQQRRQQQIQQQMQQRHQHHAQQMHQHASRSQHPNHQQIQRQAQQHMFASPQQRQQMAQLQMMQQASPMGQPVPYGQSPHAMSQMQQFFSPQMQQSFVQQQMVMSGHGVAPNQPQQLQQQQAGMIGSNDQKNKQRDDSQNDPLYMMKDKM